MSGLPSLISILTPSDIQEFPKYLAKRNKRPDARNIDLFKALLIGKELAIKQNIGGNAYRVLTKRLVDNLIEFIGSRSLTNEITQELSLFKLIVVARKLLIHNQFKLGFKLLSKAEKSAILLNDYTLLNEIYHTQIEYSFQSDAIDQSDLFRRFEFNQRNLVAQERLNMMYAVIRKAFKNNEQGLNNTNLEVLFTATQKRFGISKSQISNFKSLYQIAEIADIEGAYQKNYHSVNLFFINRIKEIEGSPVDNEKHLTYHIDLLYLIANIYFRKKKFVESRHYLDLMKLQMERFKNRFYKGKELKYKTLLALTVHYSGESYQALTYLNDLIDSSNRGKQTLAQPMLAKVMVLFHQGELDAANKVLIQLNKPDKWYKNQNGLDWLLHKKYLEILLHIELGNTDYADSRLLSLTRTYSPYFKSVETFQIIPFLKLVKMYYHNPSQVSSKEFRGKVEESLIWKAIDEEDIFLMSFYAWLKSKMENSTVYDTTLNLINQTQ